MRVLCRFFFAPSPKLALQRDNGLLIEGRRSPQWRRVIDVPFSIKSEIPPGTLGSEELR